MSESNPRQTFSNLSIPFSGTVLGGLCPGEMILVQGSVLSGADRFQVDLTCGSSVEPRADVAFHFNPRLSKGCIVCNSLQREQWGREEILYRMPFKAGASFEILILLLQDHFKVAVNGLHILQYNQRVALQRVDTISISGKVKVEAVGVLPPSTSEVAPAAAPSNQNAPMTIVSSSGDMRVPFSGELQVALCAGRSIAIAARINQDPKSFTVNLCPLEGDDIALHLNPRLRRGVWVRNSFLSGCWGPEETELDDTDLPFHPGQYFEMIVHCEPHSFRVAVNGRHLLDYRHRVQDVSRVRTVQVLGDVTLLNIKVL